MASTRGFTPADVWSLHQVTDPDVAPDGRSVAVVVAAPDRDEDRMDTSIWVAASDGSGQRRFSAGPKDTAPRWSPDGRHLAFLADRDRRDRDRDRRDRARDRGDGDRPARGGGGAQLHVAPLDGGEPRPLTSAPHGVSSPAWSPDGRHVAYVARTGSWTAPEDRTPIEASAPVVVTGLNKRLDNVGRFDDRRAHVFVVEVHADGSAGEQRQVTDGDWDDGDPSWSPDGSLLAFTSDRSSTRGDVARRDLWVVPVDGPGAPRRLSSGVGTAGSPLFSPDGTLVSFVGHEHGPGDSSRNTHLMVVPVDGSAPPRSVSAALDRTVWGLIPAAGRAHLWSGDGTSVVFLANDHGAQGAYRVGVAADAAPPEPVLGGDRQVLAIDAAGDTLAFVAVWPSAPPELWCARPDGSSEVRATTVNAPLEAEVELVPVRRVSHRAADGTTIESYVLSPSTRVEGQPAPTVLEVHGGPHGWHPQASMLALYQSLAAAGYVVLLPNPRGSHGYGEAFAGACVGDWGGADYEDLMGALDALVADGTADPERLYVGGYSYGGFMTTWIVGHTDRFAAACVSAPVSDLTSMFGTTDIPLFNVFESGGDPWERPDYYAAHSPVTHLPAVTTPVQVLHWEGDLRCPIGQGEEVFQGLRKLGKPAVLVRYPGGYHVRRTPSQMVDFVERHLSWFAAG